MRYLRLNILRFDSAGRVQNVSIYLCLCSVGGTVSDVEEEDSSAATLQAQIKRNVFQG